MTGRIQEWRMRRQFNRLVKYEKRRIEEVVTRALHLERLIQMHEDELLHLHGKLFENRRRYHIDETCIGKPIEEYVDCQIQEVIEI